MITVGWRRVRTASISHRRLGYRYQPRSDGAEGSRFPARLLTGFSSRSAGLPKWERYRGLRARASLRT